MKPLVHVSSTPRPNKYGQSETQTDFRKGVNTQLKDLQDVVGEFTEPKRISATINTNIISFGAAKQIDK